MGSEAFSDTELGRLTREKAARERSSAIEAAMARLVSKEDGLTLAEKTLFDGLDAARAVLRAPLPRRTADPGGERPFYSDESGGYDGIGAFLRDVVRAERNGVSARLEAYAAAGSDEQGVYSDPYGGFLVPKGFLADMLTIPAAADVTLGGTRKVSMLAPTLKIPARADKDHTTSVSGGLVFSRKAETVAQAASRMKVELVTLTASTLMGAVHVTEELIEDSASAFALLLDTSFRDEYAATRNREFLTGTGVGEPLGVLSSPALVTLTRAVGTAAVEGSDLVAMRARCYGYERAVWVATPELFSDLASAHLALTSSDLPLFAPGSGADVPATLLGRPLVFSDALPAPGTKGDLVLADWSQYLEGVYRPLTSAESVHVRFLEHERTLKFWIRNAGAPWWSAPLTPKAGGATRSPFVALA